VKLKQLCMSSPYRVIPAWSSYPMCQISNILTWQHFARYLFCRSLLNYGLVCAYNASHTLEKVC
jgi:hypothetical protein